MENIGSSFHQAPPRSSPRGGKKIVSPWDEISKFLPDLSPLFFFFYFTGSAPPYVLLSFNFLSVVGGTWCGARSRLKLGEQLWNIWIFRRRDVWRRDVSYRFNRWTRGGREIFFSRGKVGKREKEEERKDKGERRFAVMKDATLNSRGPLRVVSFAAWK